MPLGTVPDVQFGHGVACEAAGLGIFCPWCTLDGMTLLVVYTKCPQRESVQQAAAQSLAVVPITEPTSLPFSNIQNAVRFVKKAYKRTLFWKFSDYFT